MNRLQYLLTKLAEEASEISKIALKTQQFGMGEKLQGQPLTNAERIAYEVRDLIAVVEMLNEEFEFGFTLNLAHTVTKKEKIDRYYNYSVDLGEVKDKKILNSTYKPLFRDISEVVKQ